MIISHLSHDVQILQQDLLTSVVLLAPHQLQQGVKWRVKTRPQVEWFSPLS